MVIEIEDGVPMPKYPTKPNKYPFDGLKVGQSFFVPGLVTVTQLGGSRHHAARKFPDRKFIARVMDGGVRMWRAK